MNADAPLSGSIVDRVTRGYHLEPLRMLGEGIAGVDEIDTIMRRLGGFRVGPFERMDAIGLDVDEEISRRVWRELGEPARLCPHPLQAALIVCGHVGCAVGRGFYLYEGEPPLPAVPVERQSFDAPQSIYRAVRRFVDRATDESASFTEQYVFARTLAAMINEAALLLDEGVATTKELIDEVVKQATEHPCGPLRLAEKAGRHTCATLLRRLNERAGDHRFRPAEWLSG